MEKNCFLTTPERVVQEVFDEYGIDGSTWRDALGRGMEGGDACRLTDLADQLLMIRVTVDIDRKEIGGRSTDDPHLTVLQDIAVRTWRQGASVPDICRWTDRDDFVNGVRNAEPALRIVLAALDDRIPVTDALAVFESMRCDALQCANNMLREKIAQMECEGMRP